MLRDLKPCRVTPLDGEGVKGELREFVMPERSNIGVAFSVIDGRWPVGGNEWVRSRDVDEYYCLVKGTAVVIPEGEEPQPLMTGLWTKMERGSWYKGEFKDAEFWIVTNPPWYPEQEELK